MNAPMAPLKQHVIDPEICIRCNTCEETCPVDAVTHDDNNYVVNAEICNHCMDCISPCPTGAIDNWRVVARAYTLERWAELVGRPSKLVVFESWADGCKAASVFSIASRSRRSFLSRSIVCCCTAAASS